MCKKHKQMKLFWYIFLISFVFINENFVQWLLAIFFGHYSIVGGFNDAYKYITLEGYAFFGMFRLIPYALLGFLVMFLVKREKTISPYIAWSGLVGILSLSVWGYWDAQQALYTNAPVSSTTAIAFIFIPLYSIISGALGCIIGAVIHESINVNSKSSN